MAAPDGGTLPPSPANRLGGVGLLPLCTGIGVGRTTCGGGGTPLTRGTASAPSTDMALGGSGDNPSGSGKELSAVAAGGIGSGDGCGELDAEVSRGEFECELCERPNRDGVCGWGWYSPCMGCK